MSCSVTNLLNYTWDSRQLHMYVITHHRVLQKRDNLFHLIVCSFIFNQTNLLCKCMSVKDFFFQVSIQWYFYVTTNYFICVNKAKRKKEKKKAETPLFAASVFHLHIHSTDTQANLSFCLFVRPHVLLLKQQWTCFCGGTVLANTFVQVELKCYRRYALGLSVCFVLFFFFFHFDFHSLKYFSIYICIFIMIHTAPVLSPKHKFSLI